MTVSDGVLADTDTFRMTVRLIGPDTPTGLAASVDDQQVELSWNANSEPDLAGYNLYRSTSLPVSTSGSALNGATLLATTNYTDTGVTNNTTYYYVLTAVDSEGHASPATPAIAATPGVSVGTALTLNGSSQYVTFGAAPALGAPNFTVELWFRRTGAGVGVTTGGDGIASAIPLVTKGRSESGVDMNYFLGIDATIGTARRRLRGHGGTRTNHPVTGTTVITNNVWHHAAAAYDTATDTWRLYLDGVLDRTLALGGDFTPAAPSPSHSAIGSASPAPASPRASSRARSTKSGSGTSPRTTAQIQATENLEILSGNGLVGRYGLNEAAGTTVASSVAGAPAGALVGGPIWAPGAPLAQRLHAAGGPDRPERHGAAGSIGPHLDRDNASDLAGYNVYRSTTTPVPTTGTPLNGATPLAAATYTDTTAAPGTTYNYVVTAEDFANNESPASTSASAQASSAAVGQAVLPERHRAST